MPAVTAVLTLIIFAAGTVAGSLGALLGLGGGIFLVAFLNLGLDFPIAAAAAISLTTVIATSSSVSAARAGKQLINIRLGMVLEVATAAGSLLGGVTAQMLAQATVQKLFGAATAVVAFIMLGRLGRRNVILDPSVEPGRLGGRYHEDESGGMVTYRARRLPVALVASFIAGNLSSLLGIGGGVTAGAVIYYGHGQLNASFAAAAVLGVQLVSWGGMRFGAGASAKWLKLLMPTVLFVIWVMMLARGAR